MPFRLAVATDIHLNFVSRGEAVEFGASCSAKHGADALLITGDIAEARDFEEALLNVDAGFHRPIYTVLGNHDYYGSTFESVHAKMAALSKRHPRISWLRTAGVVELTPTTALVGIDGLYDCREGDGLRGAARMTDRFRIGDFSEVHSLRVVETMIAKGEADAARVERVLVKALRAYSEVLFATHVPPFGELAQHKDEDVRPWYIARAMGDMLIKVAARFPKRKIHVLCGRVHAGQTIEIAPNLEATSGAAEYREPAVHTVMEIACPSS